MYSGVVRETHMRWGGWHAQRWWVGKAEKRPVKTVVRHLGQDAKGVVDLACRNKEGRGEKMYKGGRGETKLFPLSKH